MALGMISKRYAKALIGFAQEQNTEATVYQEMTNLASVFASEPRMRVAMDNPIVTTKDKIDLLVAAVGSTCSPTSRRFFQLVLKNRRENVLQTMALSYCDLYRTKHRINNAKLVTAAPVSTEIVDRMKAVLQRIKPGQVELDTKVDPSIDGGFVLYVDTYRLDASVSSQLKNIKKHFILENSKIV